MRLILLMASIVVACASPAMAQNRKSSGDRPRDLNAYSLRFWPRDSLHFGQPMSATTPYGTLTCISRGRGERICSLK